MSNIIQKGIPFFLSLLFSFFLFQTNIVTGNDNNIATVSPSIRPPSVAGSFYPKTNSQLRRGVSSLLCNVPDAAPEGEILAAMAPHAGYVYSGGIAAYTFKQLSGVEIDTMVIIGHDSYLDTIAFTCPVDYFQTPLGNVQVDREMIKKMQSINKGIIDNIHIHARDHSVEVQLPFLQVLGKNCKIVPIMFGNPTVENCRLLADAIAEAGKGKRVFVLASTDMSHYPSYDHANKLDRSTLEQIKTMDVSRLFHHLIAKGVDTSDPNLKTAMCSRGGVGTAIFFSKAKGANSAQILRYANSGDASIGNKQRVVGYSSVLFIKK